MLILVYERQKVWCYLETLWEGTIHTFGDNNTTMLINAI